MANSCFRCSKEKHGSRFAAVYGNAFRRTDAGNAFLLFLGSPDLLGEAMANRAKREGRGSK